MVRASIDMHVSPFPRSDWAAASRGPWKELRRQWTTTRADLFHELLHNVRSVYIPYTSNTGVALVLMSQNKPQGPALFQPIVCGQGTER